MNCIAHYKLNDNLDNKIVVDSQSSLDGVASKNTSSFHTTGKINGAFNFSGVLGTDHIRVLHSNLLNFGAGSFSVCFWINYMVDDTQNAGYRTYVDKNNSASPYNGWDIYIKGKYDGIDTHKITLSLDDGPSFIEAKSDVLIYDGSWKFICFVMDRDNDLAIIYVNGEISGTPLDISLLGSVDSNRDLILGSSEYDPGVFGESIKNDFDNIMIFDHALSPDDIVYLWNDGEGTEDFPEATTEGHFTYQPFVYLIEDEEDLITRFL